MATQDEALKQLAKQRIASGELPCLPAARTWGSRGAGAVCSLCARPIRADEIEYEVALELESHRGEGEPGEAEPRTVRFHLPCHSAWQAECRQSREYSREADSA